MGGGISVFSLDCAIKKSKTACAHIEEFYSSTVKTPILYCIFNSDDFEEVSKNHSITNSFSLKQVTLANNDACHYDILNADKKAEKCLCIDFVQKGKIFHCEDENYSNEEFSQTHEFFSKAKTRFYDMIANQ